MGFRSGGAESQIFRELIEKMIDEELEAQADSPHEVIVSALLYVLLSWARERGGRVLASETKYALSTRRGRKPDISMFLRRDRKLPRRGAEARIIEILKLGEDGNYIHALDAAEGTIVVPGLEGLTLDLDALWRELDEGIERDLPAEGT